MGKGPGAATASRRPLPTPPLRVPPPGSSQNTLHFGFPWWLPGREGLRNSLATAERCLQPRPLLEPRARLEILPSNHRVDPPARPWVGSRSLLITKQNATLSSLTWHVPRVSGALWPKGDKHHTRVPYYVTKSRRGYRTQQLWPRSQCREVSELCSVVHSKTRETGDYRKAGKGLSGGKLAGGAAVGLGSRELSGSRGRSSSPKAGAGRGCRLDRMSPALPWK